jgi:NAD(P)-dependent dehydrogenase (short-subunit alcohol dehydrogenase family)
MPGNKVVLITGASSGIGRVTAQLLARWGATVFGTGRTPSNGVRASHCEWLPLEVGSDQSARECVNALLQKTGRLDVLINNAGYALSGAVEEATLEQAKAQFETNFFGMLRMVNLCLPVMRAQKSGQIVNIGSGASIGRAPFFGIYAASKCAVDGYTEALWHELRPLGIKVSVVQPGFFKSNIESSMRYGEKRIADYQPWRDRGVSVVQDYLRNGEDAKAVADCILGVIRNRRPALCYRVGKNTGRMALLRRFLPQSAFGWIVRRYLKIDRSNRGHRT